MMNSIEKHSIKISIGVLITVVIFLIVIASNFATWKTDMENQIQHVDERQTHLADKYVGMNERITDLENENTDFKVQMATIQTKLSNIEVMLVEIKNKLEGK